MSVKPHSTDGDDLIDDVTVLSDDDTEVLSYELADDAVLRVRGRPESESKPLSLRVVFITEDGHEVPVASEAAGPMDLDGAARERFVSSVSRVHPSEDDLTDALDEAILDVREQLVSDEIVVLDEQAARIIRCVTDVSFTVERGEGTWRVSLNDDPLGGTSRFGMTAVEIPASEWVSDDPGARLSQRFPAGLSENGRVFYNHPERWAAVRSAFQRLAL